MHNTNFINMFCHVFVVLSSVAVLIFHSSFAYKISYKPKLGMYIDRTVKSLENVVDFYVKNVNNVNLDSIYGLRVAQGGVANLLKMLPHDNSHFQKLSSLHNTMKNVAEKALPYLKEYQPDYYNAFKPIVDKPWTTFENFRKMKNRNTFFNEKHFFEEQNFDETISDKCMTEMTGTNAYTKSPCHVSMDCLKLMTNDKLKHYGTTHQVLYFLLGFQSGCRHIIEKVFHKYRDYLGKNDIDNVDNFLEKKCQQIFVEMNELKENVVGQTDLFMEQGLVCSILGYEEFLDRNILENIVIWQDKEHGCFGKEISHFQEYGAKHFVSRVTMRKILYDRTLNNGCSSHETGVATGLLSIYVRWLFLRKPQLN